MKISHATRIKNINPTNGYGYATDRMVDSLAKLGHEVNQNDPDAPVQIWFDQPQHWEWNDSTQYRIGYHPWESTLLKPGWVEKMNECDEIWTPSPIIADWYTRYAGVKVPVYIYQHGVDPVWTPKERKVEDTLNLLHVGLEAVRKGGHETIRSFRDAFQTRTDVTLTMKMVNDGWNIDQLRGIKILNRTLGLDQLVELYHDHHAFVYPSWGEGFGLTPLQAMATGMPTITVWEWAPYAHYLDPNLRISSVFKDSPWQWVHPGKMFRPSHVDLVDKMQWLADNYDQAQEFAMSKVPAITAEYDWIRLTDDAFSRLENRMKKS